MLTYYYIITVCMMASIMMAGSSLGEDRKPQMKIDVEDTTDIVPPLTESLNLTCSLVPATGKDPKDEKADFKTIDAVFISLKAPADGWYRTVAYTNNPDEAILSGLLPRATIIGSSLSGGFIKVGVAEPDINHAGDYKCEIWGINTARDRVVLTHKTNVTHKAPDVGRLAKYIHKLKVQLDEKDALLEKKVEGNHNQYAKQEERMKRQARKINNIKVKNWNQDTEINKRVSKYDIQQGHTEDCVPGYRANTVYEQITFPHRYSKTPRVFLSVGYIWGNSATSLDTNTGSEYGIQAQYVTQAGFTLACTTYRYSNIQGMRVNWIAFPSP